MGYIRHHAIVVTATYEDHDKHWIEIAHAAAESFAADTNVMVTEPTPVVVNNTRSFMVATDGSKEGWDASDEGDRVREDFIGWLRSQAYDDGSSPLAWVEVQYGDDRKVAKVCNSGDDDYLEANSERRQ